MLTGRPMAIASSLASSSFSESTSSAIFFSGLPRSMGERALHAGKAASAADTAVSTSSREASATYRRQDCQYRNECASCGSCGNNTLGD